MTHRRPSTTTIIDFGAHCHPDDPPENEFYHSFIDTELGKPVYKDLDALARQYQAAGLDGAVLSQPFYMGHPDVDRVQTANDVLLEAIEERDQYFGLAAIPTGAGGEAAAQEFQRCLDAGLHGGSLETSSEGIELHHEEIEPVLEVADQSGAPILVHPKLVDSLHPDALDDTWMLNAIFGRETALCASLCKVVHTGVLDRYQDLTLVYHHTAGNIGNLMGRVHNQLEKFPPEVFSEAPPDVVKPFEEFREQLEARIYLDTAGYYGYHSVVRGALATFPSDNILFGTDFPFETRTPDDFDAMVHAVTEETGARDAGRILGGNALDLLVNVD